MKQSAVAEILMRILLKCPKSGIVNRVKYALASRLRRVLSGRRRWLVKYNVDGTDLLIPFSHQLPIYRRFHSEYSTNIGRVAARITSKYPQAPIIDIGANVGDSIAIIRSRTDSPILAIEGDDFYFNLLNENIVRSKIRNVVALQALVGSNESLQGALHRDGGTASFVADESSSISSVRLEEILSRHPRFEDARLLKIDTDGFDCQITMAALPWLTKARPITFIEYDPTLTMKQGFEAKSVFAGLRSAGYELAICWENTGEYLITAELSNVSLLEDIDAHYSVPGSYLDIAFVHEQDRDLAHLIRRDEISFFKPLSDPRLPSDATTSFAQ